MTVFDQAFIKAYKQQRPALKSVFPETAQPAPGANVEIDGPQVPTALRSAEVKLSDLMSSLEKRAHNIVRRQDPAEAAFASAGMHLPVENEAETMAHVSPPVKRTVKGKPGPREKKKTSQAPTLEELDLPKAVYRLDPPSSTVPQAPQTASFTTSSAREKVSAESNIRVFQPMLQVDHFTWPKVCHRLETAAALELDRLTETLLNIQQQGGKIVALGGLQRGVGVTTLLLCAARRLIARSVKTVIIDADLSEPQLAKHLGVLPQLGWEDVAAGRQPVEEVLVESMADNLAILPVCTPLVVSDISSESQRRMVESLDILRKNYGLALMDLGPLENPQSFGDITVGEWHHHIDAVILVQNVGKAPTAGLPAVQQALFSAGVTVAGVIENFVPASPDP